MSALPQDAAERIRHTCIGRTAGPRGRCNREIESGISTALEFAFLFLQWAGSLQASPTHADIAARYGCSRATTYRWMNAYRAMRERVQP